MPRFPAAVAIDGTRRGGRQQAIIIIRPQELLPPDCHVVFFSTVASLIELMQIMYQNLSSGSLFRTHSVTMAIAITDLCIYCFAAAILKLEVVKVIKDEKQQLIPVRHFLYFRILNSLLHVSGFVTLSCLVSVFVPDGLRWSVYVACASLLSALIVAWDILCTIRGFNSRPHGADSGLA